MRYFDLVLLDLLGYRPAFHHCVACENPLQPVEENGFNPELGGALCPNCTRYSARRLPLLTLKVLRLVQTTEWDALPVMRLDARTRDDVEAVLEAILALNLDRSLTSWSLLHQARP
jgi:DNA repair protein RecO (recombination protein O)